MMRRIIPFCVAALGGLTSTASAADFSKMAEIPSIVNAVILLGAIACLAVALNLFALVKGGALARGWQLLIFSFVTLAVGQILILAEKLELFMVGFDIPGILYLATVILWLVSLLQTRKVLG